jgi:hypothetical protein
MEGSLEAPTRHTIPWQDEAWYDEAALDAELRRVYDICHGCRRCFNLCDSFPILFDSIDESAERGGRRPDYAPAEGRRRCLHAVRHVLHDEVPLCSAAQF